MSAAWRRSGVPHRRALERLRELYRRVEQQQLEPDDWALLAALVREEM
jgi:hypothetical protein